MTKDLPPSKALREQLEDEVRVKILGEDENKVMLERMGYVGSDLICKNCDSYMPGIMKSHEGVCEFYVTKITEGVIICEYFLPKDFNTP